MIATDHGIVLRGRRQQRRGWSFVFEGGRVEGRVAQDVDRAHGAGVGVVDVGGLRAGEARGGGGRGGGRRGCEAGGGGWEGVVLVVVGGADEVGCGRVGRGVGAVAQAGEGGDEMAVGGVFAAERAGTTAFGAVGFEKGGVWGGIGGEGGVGLGGAAGEDVEGRVDGDFEVAALGGVGGVGLGEAHYDLGRDVSTEKYGVG